MSTQNVKVQTFYLVGEWFLGFIIFAIPTILIGKIRMGDVYEYICR